MDEFESQMIEDLRADESMIIGYQAKCRERAQAAEDLVERDQWNQLADDWEASLQLTRRMVAKLRT